MKIFLMYYDRYQNATTSKMLNHPHNVLCHNNKHLFTCIGESGTLIETGQPKGIQNNFNYGLDLLEPGEWGIFMSDDVVCGKILRNTKFEKIDINDVVQMFIDLINKADGTGVKLIGMNSTGNALYAKNKYSKYGLVDGRCFAIKKTEFRWHPQINTIPDYYATLYHMDKYGGNLIANHFFLDFKRYEKGGLGSVQDRINDKIKDVNILLRLYPKNTKVQDKTNEPKGSHIIITR